MIKNIEPLSKLFERSFQRKPKEPKLFKDIFWAFNIFSVKKHLKIWVLHNQFVE